jgi:proline iminopeptidase
MAPDADAGKSSKRSDPFAPLTSEQLVVGDGHDIYVESIGRLGGIPAVYLHGGPGSGCQPDHRRLFDPERFHAILFDQRGAGRSRPKGRREDNTLPHLIADMEMIREKFGFERWMIVGGSWGATLALAYAQAHSDRVTGIVLRATFLGTIKEIENGFLSVLPRF